MATRRQWQRLLQLAADVHRLTGLCGVEERRLAGDFDRLGQLAHCHDHVDGEVDPRSNDDVGPGELREPGELRGEGVIARNEVQEPVVALAIRDGNVRRRSRRTGRGDRHPGQHAALLVANVATDGAFGRLAEEHCR